MNKVLFVVVLLGLLAVAHSAKEGLSAKIREEMENEQHLHSRFLMDTEDTKLAKQVAERSNLFFDAMDADKDGSITMEDVESAGDHLRKHAPGMEAKDFAAFLQLADENKDGKLNRHEFRQGLAKGIQASSMLETGETRRFIGAIGTGVGNLVKKGINAVKSFGRKIMGKVNEGEDACVLCQYIVERCETNVKQSGVIPSLTGAAAGPSVFLEEESITEQAPAMSLLEVQSEQKNPFDLAASSIIGATRMSTRYQRQLERQKYNEIYRVVDITLDDVCEQGMPPAMYSHCKATYALQSDIVDGLRYQYRPADICFRIAMCKKDSYITKGIHSRYKGDNHQK